jgi:two-component sensor histidine kinase
MQANRKRNFRLDDHKIVKIHDFLYSRQKYPLIILNLAIYVLIILRWGVYFEVSANYFVIFPLIVIAISFGMKGGLIAGALGLPANLILFHTIDHLEYAPASWIMAEMSGIVLGMMLGYLSDFFTRMKEEMRRRERSEKALEKSLAEKEVLLQEINHRVKNNLNLIKSFIQLQVNRLPEGESKEILVSMRNRILSIALVQDLLYSQKSLQDLDFRVYLKALTESYLNGFEKNLMTIDLKIDSPPLRLDSRKMTSLGIMVNEILTNIAKYATPEKGTTYLEISLTEKEDIITLTFKDNGPGYPEKSEGEGLGFKLIHSLLISISGQMKTENKDGGTLVLTFPANRV